MAQQTAMQELWEWIDANYHEDSFNLNDARDMSLKLEKDQVTEAYETGWVNGDLKKAPRYGKDYYNDTYIEKQS